MMSFETEVIFPRILKSLFWVAISQECYIALLFLFLKIITWNPFAGIIDWLLCLMHWKALIYQGVLCITTILFGILNMHYYSVQKHISSTRFQKICRALSPSHIQFLLSTIVLGCIGSYCCVGLFQILDPDKTTWLSSCLQLDNDFELFFVVLHGGYTGTMFTLKYFICNLYLLKFSLDQKSKFQLMKNQIYDLLKDSLSCTLKSVIWYYLFFLILGPFLQNSLFVFLKLHFSATENNLYSMISLKLFALAVISGTMCFFNWSLYILIFNLCAVERYVFNLDLPTKAGSNKCLSVALQTSSLDTLKYLAVLDLRLLAQHDVKRRQQIFAISHPGGHPYQWKSISEICILSLQNLLERLHSYTVAGKDFKSEVQTELSATHTMKPKDVSSLPNTTKMAFLCLRNRPAMCYFFDELPNAKIRAIFNSSQPLVWMTEALGFLVSASYVEDRFGVVQQTLPQIICLLLDLKKAEEKLPIDPIGIKTQVRDPQDRYEHIHQRLALKAAVNSSLCRIAATFKEDAKGIYLTDEYKRYFQRFIDRKTT